MPTNGLVADGKLLKPRHASGTVDPATTLRRYAHPVPLDDQDIADSIDAMLNVSVAELGQRSSRVA